MKDHPIAVGFNHDTTRHSGFITVSRLAEINFKSSPGSQLSIRDKPDVKTKVNSKITHFHSG